MCAVVNHGDKYRRTYYIYHTHRQGYNRDYMAYFVRWAILLATPLTSAARSSLLFSLYKNYHNHHCRIRP